MLVYRGSTATDRCDNSRVGIGSLAEPACVPFLALISDWDTPIRYNG